MRICASIFLQIVVLQYAAILKAQDLPVPRFQPALVYDETDSRVILFGGMEFDGNHLSDVWFLNESRWKPLSSSHEVARSGHAMAYDDIRKKVVVFGGMNGTGPQRDTWEYDDGHWTKVEANQLPALVGAQLVYDKISKDVVLFGGLDVERQVNIGLTWAFDGRSWRQVSESGPQRRFHHTMAYDHNRKRIVLFGGNVSEGQFTMAKYKESQRGDTWEWDGVSWKEIAVSGPSPRDHHAMAYDPDRKRIVLFGGFDGTYLDDTWEYDGIAWMKREVKGPDARGGKPGMVYDKKNKRMVLFGGGVGGGTDLVPKAMNDTWSWDGKKWEVIQ